jgi:hypothetical protein
MYVVLSIGTQRIVSKSVEVLKFSNLSFYPKLVWALDRTSLGQSVFRTQTDLAPSWTSPAQPEPNQVQSNLSPWWMD